MSFYEEEDVKDYSGNSYSQSQSHVCVMCGSNEFHKQDGVMICSSCFTQSQTNVIDEVIDDDDFAQVIGTQTQPRKLKKLKRKRSLSRYDKRIPLPTLDDCIEATQALLQIMASKTAVLAGVNQSLILLEVKRLWFGYLKAWAAGAEEYHALFVREDSRNIPRFSLRDSFLGWKKTHRIIGYIQKKIKRRLLKEDGINESSTDIELEIGKNNLQSNLSKQNDYSENSSDSFSDSDTSYTGEENHRKKVKITDPDVLPQTHKPMKPSSLQCFFPQEIPSLTEALNKTKNVVQKKIITRYEAALRTPPSMTLFIGILHRALFNLRAGVAAAHLRNWIMNGYIPFANAFEIIPSSMRQRVKSVHTFFRPFNFPKAAQIEYHSELIWIASGLDPHLKLPENKIIKNINYHRVGIIDNAPLMAARFVMDLGLTTRILDLVYALMGVETPTNVKNNNITNYKGENKVYAVDEGNCKSSKDNVSTTDDESKDEELEKCDDVNSSSSGENLDNESNDDKSNDDKSKENTNFNNMNNQTWLPPALKFAQLDYMTHPIQIMALIVVACKMCPDWENWTYTNSSTMETKESNESTTVKNENSNKRNDFDPSLQESNGPNLHRGLSVPYHETNLRLVTNGTSLESFAHFTENVWYTRHPANSHFQNIVNWISKEQAKRKSQPSSSSSSSISTKVLANPIITRPPPPPIKHCDGSTFKEIQDLIGSRPISHPAETKNIQQYTVTANRINAEWKSLINSPHFTVSPAYGLLLECVCDKFNVEPSALHKAIVKIEMELTEIGVCVTALQEGKRTKNHSFSMRRNMKFKFMSSKGAPGGISLFEKYKFMKIREYHTMKKPIMALKIKSKIAKKKKTFKRKEQHSDAYYVNFLKSVASSDDSSFGENDVEAESKV